MILQLTYNYTVYKAEATQILADLYELLQSELKRSAKIKRSANNINMTIECYVKKNNLLMDFYENYVERFFRVYVSI